MKNWLLIFILFLTASFSAMAQTDEPDGEAGKIQARMSEYIQKKLGLTKNEADKFTPVFNRYFKDFVQTHRENKGDRLVMQQKIIDLRLKYRTEFRQIMDEDRANKVYKYEDSFRQEAIRIIRENRRDRLQERKTKGVMIQERRS